MIIGNKTKTPKADKDLWATPWDVFLGTEKLLGRTFDLDVCASQHNAKCEWYILPLSRIVLSQNGADDP